MSVDKFHDVRLSNMAKNILLTVIGALVLISSGLVETFLI